MEARKSKQIWENKSLTLSSLSGCYEKKHFCSWDLKRSSIHALSAGTRHHRLSLSLSLSLSWPMTADIRQCRRSTWMWSYLKWLLSRGSQCLNDKITGLRPARSRPPFHRLKASSSSVLFCMYAFSPFETIVLGYSRFFWSNSWINSSVVRDDSRSSLDLLCLRRSSTSTKQRLQKNKSPMRKQET